MLLYLFTCLLRLHLNEKGNGKSTNLQLSGRLWRRTVTNYKRHLMCWRIMLQVKGENDAVNVKRLPKKKAPPRFGRKLTAQQKANATHICVGAVLRSNTIAVSVLVHQMDVAISKGVY